MTRCKLWTTATATVLVCFAGLTTASDASNATGIDKVPDLNMQPTCRSTADQALDLEDKPTIQSCLDEEQGARQALDKEWTTFPAADRRFCTTANQTGGPPSYINLLWCLRDAKSAKELEQKPPATTGTLTQE